MRRRPLSRRTGRDGGSGLHWVKSSLSYANGNCVEVARPPGGQVLVRDSTDPDGPRLAFSPGHWAAFVRGVKQAPRG